MTTATSGTARLTIEAFATALRKGETMERIKIFRNQPFVLIDDDFGEMMNWAVRYALGRRTYAVGDTCRFVKSVLPYLDYKTLYVMARDIKEKSDFDDLGDQCDADDWLDLMKAIAEHVKEAK